MGFERIDDDEDNDNENNNKATNCTKREIGTDEIFIFVVIICVQTAELRISDDPVSSQRDEGVVLSMETTEAVPNVVPREETTSNLEQSAGASSSDLPEM